MLLYIHTYGRADNQLTYEALPKKLQEKVIFVVQDREKKLYSRYPNVMVLPKNIKTLSPTRQYIMEQHYANYKNPKLVLLDDDLKFATRREDDRTKFTPATSFEILALFTQIRNELEYYDHVGVLAREGANRILTPKINNTRMMRILAYDAETFHKENIRFDRVPCKQDFDVTLQFLRKGYSNLVLCNWVQDQGGSNTAGGCSVYRDKKMLEDAAYRLEELHPKYVKVVVKATKQAWGGGERIDVVVQWKKAFLEYQECA